MNGIRSVALVSDGILVSFADGTRCYFPASFLEEHIGIGANQIFLDHDPSGQAEFSEGAPSTLPATLPC